MWQVESPAIGSIRFVKISEVSFINYNDLRNCEYKNTVKNQPCSELVYRTKKLDLDGLERVVCHNHLWLVGDQKQMYEVISRMLRKERSYNKLILSIATLSLIILLFVLSATIEYIIFLIFIAFMYFLVFDP